MSPSERRLFNRISQRAATMQPSLGKRLLATYALIRDTLTESELARAINDRLVDRLIYTLMSDEALAPSLASLRTAIQQNTLNAAASWSQVLPNFAAAPMFDAVSPRVIEAVRTLDNRAIKDLRDEVRETVRQAAESGMRAGQNPRVVARHIRDVIGLAPNQEQAVRNFRAQLESGDRAALQRALGKGVITTPDGTQTTRQAHAGGQGLTEKQLATLDRTLGKVDLTPEQVDKAVGAYQKRMMALNTETHTKSIALDTQRIAQRMSWQSSIDQGIVEEHRLRRVWIAVMDNRTREEHAAMNGEEIGWTGVYSTGEEVPGADSWNCRCIERVVYAPQ